jgi:hypothetical protein
MTTRFGLYESVRDIISDRWAVSPGPAHQHHDTRGEDEDDK